MQMSRRRMLTLSLGGGVLLSAGVGTLSSMRQPSRQPGLVEVTRKGRGLGTDLSLTVIARSTSTGEQAIEAAFAEIETVEQVMSLYRPDSQICQLNRERLLKNPHPYLRASAIIGFLDSFHRARIMETTQRFQCPNAT